MFHTQKLLAAIVGLAIAGAGTAAAQRSTNADRTGDTGAMTDDAMTRGPGARSGAAREATKTPARGGARAMRGQAAMRADMDFLATASSSGILEKSLANVALGHSRNEEVQRYAREMLEDHQKVDNELAQLAATQGVAVPQRLMDRHEAIQKQVATQVGTTFDRAYLQSQVQSHTEAVQLFERQAQGGRSAELRKFASARLPVLREHLRMAQELERRVGQGA